MGTLLILNLFMDSFYVAFQRGVPSNTAETAETGKTNQELSAV